MGKKVLEPIQIGSVTVKNRIVYLAQGKAISEPDGFTNDREVAFYETLAKGGAGMIIPACLIIDPDWPSILPNQMAAWDDKFIPSLKRLVDAVHKYDSKLFYQPWHPGMVDYTGKGTPKLHELTVEEIHAKQRMFAESALRCKKAGADGIEFQICHNYLACDFFTPLFNTRTDEYGCDTMENSLRFSLEAIAMIQEACGRDFPIIVKLQSFDNKEGGITPERAAEAAPYLEKAGAAMISVSAGGKLTGVTLMAADGRQQEGWKVPFAEAVKKVVNIPVCATDSLRHLDYMEQILAEGKCDLIGMARGLVAEPNFVNKVAEGREDELRHCMSCCHCMTDRSGTDVSNCTVNPLAQREVLGMDELKKDGNGRVVAIIGAGPAGMEAAVTLAQRGFKPIVFEASGKIGGMARLAAVPDGKTKMNWLIDYYERQSKRQGIEMRYHTEATPEVLQSLNPYAVIVATGSQPLVVPVKGIDEGNVMQVRDVLEDFPAITEKKIVIVGAGITGLETALTFRGRGNQVTVIDMLESLPNAADMEYALAKGYAMGYGVAVKMQHKLLEITESGVLAEDLTSGSQVAMEADLVVLSMGILPENRLYEELKNKFDRVINIGDSSGGTTILQAVQAGYDTAYAI